MWPRRWTRHRALEVQRLDALQVPLWDKAMDGDIKAVNTILRISEQRSRLLGLHKPDVAHSGSGTLVDPAYWAGLKET